MNFTCVNNATGAMEGFCLIKSLEQKTTQKGQTYLDMVLMDTSGEIVAKFWDFRADAHSGFKPNDLVKVRGTQSVYNGQNQFRVERLRAADDNDGIRMSDFVPSAPQSGEEMLAEIREAVAAFTDEHLRALVETVLEEQSEKLLYWPAAYRLHHAVRSGLLWHTVTMLRIARAVAAQYDVVNLDLLSAGVILHDIDKTSEYDVPSTGLALGYTVKGNLVGHLVGGAVYLEQKARALGTPEETLLLLQHMLISHHGEPEFGAAMRPAFLEAELLSEIDLLDARMNQMQQALSGVQPGEFTNKIWAMENRKLYRPRGA